MEAEDLMMLNVTVLKLLVRFVCLFISLSTSVENLNFTEMYLFSFLGFVPQYKNYMSAMEENAKKHHEATLKKKVFWAWFDIFSEEKSMLWGKQKIADQYRDRRIMLTAFGAWWQFPKLMKEEREKEGRLAQLRKKVAEILPDFRT